MTVIDISGRAYTVLDLPFKGEMRKQVVTTGKLGIIESLDRTTCNLDTIHQGRDTTDRLGGDMGTVTCLGSRILRRLGGFDCIMRHFLNRRVHFMHRIGHHAGLALLLQHQPYRPLPNFRNVHFGQDDDLRFGYERIVIGFSGVPANLTASMR